jgi:hypothetical protein
MKGGRAIEKVKKLLPNSAELDLSLPLFAKLRLKWEREAGRPLTDQEARDHIVVYLRTRPVVTQRRSPRRSITVGNTEYVV